MAVEVSATGVFFHGLPRVTELEVCGRRWEKPRRRPACAAAPRADEERGGSGGAKPAGGGCGKGGCSCAAKPRVDEGSVEAAGDDVEAPPAPPPLPTVPEADGSMPSAHQLIAELQQPVLLPPAPVLDSSAALTEEGVGKAVGSEVFMFVHGLGEDFGNGGWKRSGGPVILLGVNFGRSACVG